MSLCLKKEGSSTWHQGKLYPLDEGIVLFVAVYSSRALVLIYSSCCLLLGVDRLSAPILSIFTIIDIGHRQTDLPIIFFIFYYANKHTIYRWQYLLVNKYRWNYLMFKCTSPTNQRGKLKAVSHRKHLLTGAASVITHQLSLKDKAAADVAEVAINHNPLHRSCKTPQYNLWCPRCGKCGVFSICRLTKWGHKYMNNIPRTARRVTSWAFDRFIWVKRSSYHIYIGYRNLKGSHGNLSKYKFGLAEYITVYVIQLQQLQLLLRIITQYAISSMF